MAEPTANEAQPPAENPAATPMSALEEDDEFSKYTVHAKTEILHILNSMRASNALVTVHFNHGKDFLLTSVIGISADGSTVILDVGSNAEMNNRALQTDKLTCNSSQGKVKIQFTLDGVDPTMFEGRKALLGNVPKTLVRLQRRDFYRLTAPLANPLICHIPIQEADGSTRTIGATVVDISGGGLAMVLPPEEHNFETDTLLSNCRMDLPNVGTVNATMRVRSIFDVTLASGKILKRSGCQFIKLPGAMVTMIQRYIIQVDRERKGRE